MTDTKTLTALLLRGSSSDQGTFGTLVSGDFSCFTAELPWRDNQRKISCIPDGDYEVRAVKSPKFGQIYGLFGVPGRSYVLIHSGNFAGDVSKGYKSHVEGCILLGSKVGRIQSKEDGTLQKAVLVSLPTVRRFMEYMGMQPFTLMVRTGYQS